MNAELPVRRGHEVVEDAQALRHDFLADAVAGDDRDPELLLIGARSASLLFEAGVDFCPAE